jgi:alpha-tubulin suppressor-like RCC1 family protein
LTPSRTTINRISSPCQQFVFTPTLITFATNQSFTEVALLETHSCALTVQHTTYCWGVSARGRLGQSNPTTVECPGVIDVNTSLPARCVAQPIAVSGNIGLVSLVAGTHHTCGLDSEGRAYCWGSGTWAELGNGRTGVDNWTATPEPVAGALRFRALTAGQFFTCGIATNDATYCWGANDRGQLGAALTSPLQAFRSQSLAPDRLSGRADHAAARLCLSGRAYSQQQCARARP